MAVILEHNLDPRDWMWLWAKYVVGYNPTKHCTNSIRGPYSRRFSGHNEQLASQRSLLMDESAWGSFAAIYFCGVAKQGYQRKTNYPHNLHAVVVPEAGASGEFAFEGWRLSVTGGRFAVVPGLEQLADEYRSLPEAYTTCRIFRWAVTARPEGARLLG